MRFEACPYWTWARVICSECGLKVSEEFSLEQASQFTSRRFFGTGPLTEHARQGREAVRWRLMQYFKEKGCPHG